MQRSHFRLLGIPVRIDPTFGLVALFGLGLGTPGRAAAWVGIIFVTTLVHELGHALAFRAFGRSSHVSLWAFGGLTQGEGPALERTKSIAVSLAGPLSGMVLLGLPALFVRSAIRPVGVAGGMLEIFIWVAIAWSAVNLLPVIPLDGGHVAANLFEGLWGKRGLRAAYILSVVVAATGGGFALSRGFIFAAMFCAFFIMQNVRDLAGLRDADLESVLRNGHALLDAGLIDQALHTATDVRRRSRTAHLRAHAVELAAWALLAAGRRAEAGSVLQELPKDLRPSRSLLAAFLIADGQRDAAVQAAAEAMRGEDIPNRQLERALNRAGLTSEVEGRLA